MNLIFRPLNVTEIRTGDLVRKPGSDVLMRVRQTGWGRRRRPIYTDHGEFRPKKTEEWFVVPPGSPGTRPDPRLRPRRRF